MIVSDVMTRKVLSVAPDETVEHAAGLMLRHGISGLFVVDANGTLAGVITEGDLLRRDEIGTERHRPSPRIIDDWAAIEYGSNPGQAVRRCKLDAIKIPLSAARTDLGSWPFHSLPHA